jgi:small subunit ribosomal protein S1
MSAVSSLISMDELLKNSPVIFKPEPGTMVEGKVITIYKNRILVDLGGVSTGIIAGKEAIDSSETLKDLQPGDEITALVLEPENDEGLVVLSLRKASQHKTWQKFVDFFNKREVIKVKITEANKGGLLVEVDSIKGFIPVSQLAPLHYPRVNGADSAKILSRLQKLVGELLSVRIINIDDDNRKLILSEKEAQDEDRRKSLGNINIGDIVEGSISGVVNFGIFVTFNGLEGLVHISEIAWGHVSDPSVFGRLGDKIKVKVIGIEGEKISLSMKQLVENPWLEVAKQFEVGQMVKGTVNRITEYGAFISLKDDINGLIHVSELGSEEEKSLVADKFKVGQEIEAKIINVDIDNHRIGLALPEDLAKAAKKKDSSSEDSSPNSNDLESLGLSAKAIKVLTDAGFGTLESLKGATEEDLKQLDGMTEASLKKIFSK